MRRLSLQIRGLYFYSGVLFALAVALPCSTGLASYQPKGCDDLLLLPRDVVASFLTALRVRSIPVFQERVAKLFAKANVNHQRALRGGRVALDPDTGHLVVRDALQRVVVALHLAEAPYGLSSRTEMLNAMAINLSLGQSLSTQGFHWDSLGKHFEAHRREFETEYRALTGKSLTAISYEALAKEFAQSTEPQCLSVVNKRGERLKFDPYSEKFLVVAPEGHLISFHRKSSESLDYYYLRAFQILIKEMAKRYQ